MSMTAQEMIALAAVDFMEPSTSRWKDDEGRPCISVALGMIRGHAISEDGTFADTTKLIDVKNDLGEVLGATGGLFVYLNTQGYTTKKIKAALIRAACPIYDYPQEDA